MTVDHDSCIAAPPYTGLDPDNVLRLLDGLGLRGDGRLLQLNSYENRVFQVFLEDGRVVIAKVYRPARWSDEAILEEHDFARELAAADVPVVAPEILVSDASGPTLIGKPPTLARGSGALAAFRVAVAARHAGRSPELEDPHALRWLGRFLGRLHTIGAQRSFVHRPTAGPVWFGHAARQRLLDGGCVPEAQRPQWTSSCDAALACVDQAFAARPTVQLRLHGDFHPGNIMWRDEGPHVVDLDDACNGPAVQDLWMLLSGDAAAMREQLEPLLAGYRMFRAFDERELALIEPLRTLRMVHHSAWIAARWHDPAFPAAFPWFGSAAYWSQQSTQLREQVEAMQSAA